ncbi:two-component system response regulator [Methyloprofundus sedimenti]|uniref:Two-component system response regulator n=1 Tax=Methyloprofundus sedimenti TaxID=1420851 RepID=A0A1V8M9R2_9GAMM|nr:response regulator transcription factor [Methyloprofundus sedimenti]OQK18299.1 two-component system response regulator [Methyloprofundus sedimenti]
MTHILIIDDDSELSSMLGEYLSAEGLSIDYAFDGKQGLQKALAGQYDAVVLDVMMPELDGFEVLRRIRGQSSVPVLMLTAKGDDIDRIVGLEIGADDYLPKPFNPRELLARIRAVLRRTQNNRQHDLQEQVQHIGPLQINPSSRTALVRGQVLDLTSTEFNLLHSLVKQVGKIVSKENLSAHGLGRALEKYDRSIDMHMSNLRKKLAQYELGSMIVTVRGQGYQLSDEA